MSKNQDLFSNLLTGFLSPDFLMKFLDAFKSENVSVKSDGDSVVVNVNTDVDDEDYDNFVKYLLSVVSAHEVSHDYTMKLTIGKRATDVYKYNHESGEFEFVGNEAKEKEQKSEKDLPTKKENNKTVPAGVKCEVKEKNDDIDEMPFAQWLKSNVQTDIDNGLYEFDSDEMFDVDEAINNLIAIYDTESYEIMTNEKNELIGIRVPITALCDIIEPCDTTIDIVLEKEGGNIAEFVNRCIFELGFSNVIPDTIEGGENVTSTEPVEKYKDIFFKLYF